VGPFLLPEALQHWFLVLILFMPLLPALQSTAQRIWPPRGAKVEAHIRFLELMMFGGADGKLLVFATRLGVLLTGCVVGVEVGKGWAAGVGQAVGALLGTVTFWMAAVALGWWSRPAADRDATRWRPAVLAALGGVALLWLGWGALQGEDEAVVLKHPQPVL